MICYRFNMFFTLNNIKLFFKIIRKMMNAAKKVTTYNILS